LRAYGLGTVSCLAKACAHVLPLDWLRRWRVLDRVCSAWAKGVDELLGKPPKNPPRLHPHIEPLEDRTLLATSPVGSAFVALTRESFSGIVGSFTPESGRSYMDYHVNIIWGDGQHSSGTIDSSCNVSGAHTYNAAGSYAIAIQVVNNVDSSTSVGLGLALVESLTKDTDVKQSDGGEQRQRHYAEFHAWRRAKYNKTDAYFE
jgi:hypothetical protein